VRDLPSVGKKKFLTEVADTLERLRSESEWRGHALLASLLEITRGEAEDELKTHAETLRLANNHVRGRKRGLDDDDGVIRMAAKLAKPQGA
jgi:hypothetical protein